MTGDAAERPRPDDAEPPGRARPADRDEPGPGDRERLDRAEREAFEDDAMRERDA
jgi:hypothetical protein